MAQLTWGDMRLGVLPHQVGVRPWAGQRNPELK
jgi:hypothetical protein